MNRKSFLVCLFILTSTSIIQAFPPKNSGPGGPYWRRPIAPAQPRPKHHFPSLEVCHQRARERANSYLQFCRSEAEVQQVERHYQELLEKCTEMFTNP